MKRIIMLAALAAAGCTRPLTQEEELRMNCDRVAVQGLDEVWRCENLEAVCYAYRDAISCYRKRAPAPAEEA